MDGLSGEVSLDRIVDVGAIRELIEDFHSLTGHALSLVDLDDHFLVQVGWHDACSLFHRMNPESAELCRQSDTDMIEDIARGEIRAYRCKNGLWHVAAPLFVGDRQVGNIFTSQFFYDDDDIDLEWFAERAERFGYDRDAYLAAIEAIPRYSHATVDALMRFYEKLAGQIALLGLTNLELEVVAASRERALEQRLDSEERFAMLVGNAPIPIAVNDAGGAITYLNEEFTRVLGYTVEDIPTVDAWSRVAYPDEAYRTVSMAQWAKDVAAAPGLGGRIEGREYSATCKNGEVRTIVISGAMVGGNVLVLMHDLTERKFAEQSAEEGAARLERMVYEVASSMGRIVEARDPYTQGHQQRVAELGSKIGRKMGLSGNAIEEIEMAGLLHDVGKLRVPTEILTKPGHLSPVEMDLIREHPAQSHEILKTISFPWAVAEIALQHHERMDGSGYPRGLKGDEILPAARILAVADVVEAMASHRPYRPTLGVEAAIAEIESQEGVYDPEVVAACVALYREGALGL